MKKKRKEMKRAAYAVERRTAAGGMMQARKRGNQLLQDLLHAGEAMLLGGLLLGAAAGISAVRETRSKTGLEASSGRSSLQVMEADREEGEWEEKTVALTFDDGPHSKWTPLLLDGLKERGVKATFFLMGENIEGNEEIVRRMAQEGHLIGNHSYRHVQLTKAGMENVCAAFEKTGDLIESLTGSRPSYVRPPYGDWNEELECRTRLITVFWDVDSLDWKYKNRRRVADKVCREVQDGDIILMHDIFQTSEEAALDIVDRLTAEGWQFVTVDELVVD